MDEYKPTFGILVPARRGFGTPAGDPCCCHASPPSPFVNRRERERGSRIEVFGNRRTRCFVQDNRRIEGERNQPRLTEDVVSFKRGNRGVQFHAVGGKNVALCLTVESSRVNRIESSCDNRVPSTLRVKAPRCSSIVHLFPSSGPG